VGPALTSGLPFTSTARSRPPESGGTLASVTRCWPPAEAVFEPAIERKTLFGGAIGADGRSIRSRSSRDVSTPASIRLSARGVLHDGQRARRAAPA
jgi:hypothetical protein